MSAHYSIERGRKFLFEGRVLTYKRSTKGSDPCHVFENEDKRPYTFSFEDIRNARADNTMCNWTPPSTASVCPGEVIHRARVTIATARDVERAAVDRYLAYINAWMALPGTPRSTRGLQPIIDTVYARRLVEANAARRYEPPPFSVSRFQQLIRAYINGGCHADALVPQTGLRGNHRQRLNQTIMDIVHNKMDEVYLQLNGATVAGLHAAIEEAIKGKNRFLPPGAFISPPSYASIRKFVADSCPYTREFCRKGKQSANLKFRMIGSGVVTERANEIWEIDDTRVDLICLSADGKTVIGRPWMIIVIDRHTRMIMSFVLTFSPPDTESALEAVKLAIHNKDRVSRANPDFKTGWPAEGRPEAIHVDNGKQYNSIAFKAGVATLGIRLNTMPFLKAWYKGVVERVIGTVMRQVFHVVPGTTYANIFDRDQETLPEKVAVATLADAQAKLLSWVVDEYQHRHHRGIEATPFNMWKASIEEHPVLMPHTAEQVDVALSITVARKVRHGNIVLDGLHYLAEHGVAMEMAARYAVKSDVIVRRDPGNLTIIHFLDAGITDVARADWHVAHLRKADRPRVEGHTLKEFQLARAVRAKYPDLADGDPTWGRIYSRIKDDRDEAAASPLLAKRRRAEGERERVRKQARHQVEREKGVVAGVAGGGDLHARLDAADPPAPTAGEPPVADRDADEPLEALRRNRTSRSRHYTPRED